MLKFHAPAPRFLFVDHSSGKVCIDRHLFAGDGIEREPCSHFGDSCGTLRDNQKVDRQQNGKHDQTDYEIAGHHHIGKAADDIAGGVVAAGAFRKDEPGRGNVQRQSQHHRNQKDRGERGEFQGPANPQGHHQDKNRQGNRAGQPHVHENRWQRQEQNTEDEYYADGEADVAATLRLSGWHANIFSTAGCHRRPPRKHFFCAAGVEGDLRLPLR